MPGPWFNIRLEGGKWQYSEDGGETWKGLNSPEGVNLLSTGVTGGWNIVADGFGGVTWQAAAPGGSDEHAKVSANDTTAGYLNGKLVAGANVILTEINDGSDETLEIAADKYTDPEAVTAMGIKTGTNSLNHDRYTDSEAITAALTTIFSMSTYQNVVTIAKSGAEYTSIQTALNANPNPNIVFMVGPGEYDEFVSFTANNQALVGMGNGQTVLSQIDDSLIDFGAFTACAVERFTLKLTNPTAARDMVVGSGSCFFQFCIFQLTQSASFAGIQSTLINTSGQVRLYLSTCFYAHSGAPGGLNIKYALDVSGNGFIWATSTEMLINNTGACFASTLCVILDPTASIDFNDSRIDITDDTATIVAGIGYIAAGGNFLLHRNSIYVNAGATNSGYGLYVSSGSVKSCHNYFHITNTGGLSYGFYGGNGAILDSQMDDIIAADGDNIQPGCTFYQASARDNGRMDITGPLVVGYTTVNVATYDTQFTDAVLHITRTATGTCVIQLMSNTVIAGVRLMIKDAAGNAAANNIAITTEGAETIDGQATITMSGDYGSISLYSDGSNWFIF